MPENIFGNNIKYLRKKSGITQAGLAEQVGKKHTSVGNWETGFNEPSLTDLLKIADIFGVSVDDLLKSDYAKGKGMQLPETAQKGKLKGKGMGKVTAENSPKSTVFSPYFAADEGSNYGVRTPAVIVTSEKGMERIIDVPARAQAGYLVGYSDPEYVETLPTWSVPGLKGGTYRSFEVIGPSMAPTLKSGDRVVGRWVENFDNIVENHVHVVVTKDGIVVKRVQNRIKERGKIVLKSDTITHRKEYPTYQINPEDVREIWYVIFDLTADLSEPGTYYQKLNDLELDVLELRTMIENMSPVKAAKPKTKIT